MIWAERSTGRLDKPATVLALPSRLVILESNGAIVFLHAHQSRCKIEGRVEIAETCMNCTG